MDNVNSSSGNRLVALAGTHSAIGKHSCNQDRFLFFPKPNEPQSRWVAVVADGVTHCAGGEKAAEIVISDIANFAKLFIQGHQKIDDIDAFIGVVNDSIVKYNNYHPRIACTCLALVCDNQRCRYIQIGDSNLFLWRKGEIISLNDENRDKAGYLKEAMGLTSRLHPISGDFKLEAGDRLLLATDGLYEAFTQRDIALELSLDRSPSEVAKQLVKKAKNNFTTDDATAVVIQITAVQPSLQSSWSEEAMPSLEELESNQSRGMSVPPQLNHQCTCPTSQNSSGSASSKPEEPYAVSDIDEPGIHDQVKEVDTFGQTNQLREFFKRNKSLTVFARILIYISCLLLAFALGIIFSRHQPHTVNELEGALDRPYWVATVPLKTTLLPGRGGRGPIVILPEGHMLELAGTGVVLPRQMKNGVNVDFSSSLARQRLAYWDDKNKSLVYKWGEERQLIPFQEKQAPSGIAIDKEGNAWLLFSNRLWFVPRQKQVQ